MTIFIALFLSALLAVCAKTILLGDLRDQLGVATLIVAVGCTYAVLALQIPDGAKVLAHGLVWCLHGFVILWYSTRLGGSAIGVMSFMIALMAGFAHFGWLDYRTGQGIAANYWHYSTLMNYGQLAVVWQMAGRHGVVS